MTNLEGARCLTIHQDGEELRIWLERPDPVEETPAAAAQLATLLAPAIACGARAPALAGTLLANFRSVGGVFNARPDRLAAVPGMTPMAQGVLAAAHALACEVAAERVADRDLLDCWEDLITFLRVKLRGRRTEAAYALFLDHRNRLIEMVHFGEGTVDRTIIYAREIVRQALILDTSAVILVHNHPSGDPTPSPTDIAFTRNLANALATLDIALHDHVIVGDAQVASVRVAMRQ
jgi:DNA repair protein RadC